FDLPCGGGAQPRRGAGDGLQRGGDDVVVDADAPECGAGTVADLDIGGRLGVGAGPQRRLAVVAHPPGCFPTSGYPLGKGRRGTPGAGGRRGGRGWAAAGGRGGGGGGGGGG